MKIAFVRLSAIGDVVHSLPLVISLRAAYPSAHISWIIQPGPYELLKDHPAVDEFILFDRGHPFRALRDLRRGLGKQKFDLVVAPHTAIKAGLATWLLRADRKVGFDRKRAPELNWLFTTDRIPAAPRSHQQDEMLEFADYLGIERIVAHDLDPTDDERGRYRGLLPKDAAPLIAIALASSQSEKDWPADRFAELVQRLRSELGATIVVVGGLSAAEDQAFERIRDAAGDNRLLDRRAWDLRGLAYLLSEADLFVGGDSAPLHIAVALETPAVALMGFTNPLRFGPTRFRHLMVDAFSNPGETLTADAHPRPGRMTSISVQEVFRRVTEALDEESLSGQKTPILPARSGVETDPPESTA